MRRPTYTVYCETCKKQLASYVLGRGFVDYSKKSAQRRATEHAFEVSDHVVTVKEKA